MLGRDRILLTFFPTPAWLHEAAEREGQLQDYELQVLAVVPPQVLASAPCSSSWLHIGPAQAGTREAFEVSEGESKAFLIGKDRGVKRVCAGHVSLDEVLALIDTMPMRQAEVRGQR